MGFNFASMYKSFSEISNQLIALSLIAVVGLHSLNSFFNTHSHKLADGTVVVHAHPYERSSDSSPFETHQHTATELVFLASLLHFIPSIAVLLVGFVLINWNEFARTYKYFSNQFIIGIPSLRGPPAQFI